MENDLLDALNNLGYEGPLTDETAFAKALEGGPKSLVYTKLVHILAKELKSLLNLKETVNIMNDPDDSSAFLLELSSFLRELGCSYRKLVTGHMSTQLQSKEDKLLLLDYLVSELMAARMVAVDCPKEKPAAGMEIVVQESPTAKDLKDILISLKFSKPPPNITPEMLFTKLEAKIKATIQKEGAELVGKPLCNKSLSEKEWKQLENVFTEMYEEYRLRRETLITRLECTIGFEWSDRKREQLKVKPDVRLSDFLAARTDLLTVENISSTSVRKNTQSDVNKVIIGQVPDRGGRPNEQQPPPPEMPSWQQQRGPGGGRGGGGFGGGGGGRGGGGPRGGRVQGGYNQGGQGEQRPQTSPAAFSQNQRSCQTFELPPGDYNQHQGGYNQNQKFGGQGLQETRDAVETLRCFPLCETNQECSTTTNNTRAFDIPFIDQRFPLQAPLVKEDFSCVEGYSDEDTATSDVSLNETAPPLCMPQYVKDRLIEKLYNIKQSVAPLDKVTLPLETLTNQLLEASLNTEAVPIAPLPSIQASLAKDSGAKSVEALLNKVAALAKDLGSENVEALLKKVAAVAKDLGSESVKALLNKAAALAKDPGTESVGALLNKAAALLGAPLNQEAALLGQSLNTNTAYLREPFNTNTAYLGEPSNINTAYWGETFNTNTDYWGEPFNTNTAYWGELCNTNTAYWGEPFNTNPAYWGKNFNTNTVYIAAPSNTNNAYWGEPFNTNTAYFKEPFTTKTAYFKEPIKTETPSVETLLNKAAVLLGEPPNKEAYRPRKKRRRKRKGVPLEPLVKEAPLNVEIEPPDPFLANAGALMGQPLNKKTAFLAAPLKTENLPLEQVPKKKEETISLEPLLNKKAAGLMEALSADDRPLYPDKGRDLPLEPILYKEAALLEPPRNNEATFFIEPPNTEAVVIESTFNRKDVSLEPILNKEATSVEPLLNNKAAVLIEPLNADAAVSAAAFNRENVSLEPILNKEAASVEPLLDNEAAVLIDPPNPKAAVLVAAFKKEDMPLEPVFNKEAATVELLQEEKEMKVEEKKRYERNGEERKREEKKREDPKAVHVRAPTKASLMKPLLKSECEKEKSKTILLPRPLNKAVKSTPHKKATLCSVKSHSTPDECLCVAIVTKSFFPLTNDEVTTVINVLEKAIDDEIKKKSSKGRTASFCNKKVSNGKIKLQCEDKYSLHWLLETVSKIKSPRPGTRLVVCKQSDVPKSIKPGSIVPTLRPLLNKKAAVWERPPNTKIVSLTSRRPGIRVIVRKQSDVPKTLTAGSFVSTFQPLLNKEAAVLEEPPHIRTKPLTPPCSGVVCEQSDVPKTARAGSWEPTLRPLLNKEDVLFGDHRNTKVTLDTDTEAAPSGALNEESAHDNTKVAPLDTLNEQTALLGGVHDSTEVAHLDALSEGAALFGQLLDNTEVAPLVSSFNKKASMLEAPLNTKAVDIRPTSKEVALLEEPFNTEAAPLHPLLKKAADLLKESLDALNDKTKLLGRVHDNTEVAPLDALNEGTTLLGKLHDITEVASVDALNEPFALLEEVHDITEVLPLDERNGQTALLGGVHDNKEVAPSDAYNVGTAPLGVHDNTEVAPLNALNRQTAFLEVHDITKVAPLDERNGQTALLGGVHYNTEVAPSDALNVGTALLGVHDKIEIAPLDTLNGQTVLLGEVHDITEVASLDALNEQTALLGVHDKTEVAPLDGLNGQAALLERVRDITDVAPLDALNEDTAVLGVHNNSEVSPLDELDGQAALLDVHDNIEIARLDALNEETALLGKVHDNTEVAPLAALNEEPALLGKVHDNTEVAPLDALDEEAALLGEVHDKTEFAPLAALNEETAHLGVHDNTEVAPIGALNEDTTLLGKVHDNTEVTPLDAHNERAELLGKVHDNTEVSQGVSSVTLVTFDTDTEAAPSGALNEKSAHDNTKVAPLDTLNEPTAPLGGVHDSTEVAPLDALSEGAALFGQLLYNTEVAPLVSSFNKEASMLEAPLNTKAVDIRPTSKEVALLEETFNTEVAPLHPLLKIAADLLKEPLDVLDEKIALLRKVHDNTEVAPLVSPFYKEASMLEAPLNTKAVDIRPTSKEVALLEKPFNTEAATLHPLLKKAADLLKEPLKTEALALQPVIKEGDLLEEPITTHLGGRFNKDAAIPVGTSLNKEATLYAVSPQNATAECARVAIITEPFFPLNYDEITAVVNALEDALDDDIFNPSSKNRTPSFSKVVSHGIVKIKCDDHYSLHWLKETVSKITPPRSGAKLVVCKQSDVPKTVRAELFVPKYKVVDISSVHLFYTYLKHKNPWFNVEQWNEVQIVNKSDGVLFVLEVPLSEVTVIILGGRVVSCGNISAEITFVNENST